MALLYAGEELLLDQTGQIQEWFDRFMPLSDLRLFGSTPVGVSGANLLPRNPTKQGVGLCTPNWSEPPRLRLNTLFWPAVGATRWAYFVGMVDEDRLNRIIANINTGNADPNNKYGELVIGEGDSHHKRSVIPKMYMLPPRRVTVDATAGSGKLWLLPLVDERYLWQYRHCTSFNVASTYDEADWTWENFLRTTQGGGTSGLGFTLPFSGSGFDKDAVSADYFLPDGLTFDTLGENMAVVLDAAASSIGTRVVRAFDGTVYLMTPPKSQTRLQDSLGPAGLTGETQYEIIMGGMADKYNALTIPRTLGVLFPKWWSNGNYWRVYGNFSTAGALSFGAGVDPATLTNDGFTHLNSTAEAEFTWDSLLASNSPTNQADLITLAAKIATDWYAWRAKFYDFTFAGVKVWKPCGFDDWIIYTMANPLANGEPTTRVMSLPYDFGTEQQYQQFRYNCSRGIFCASSTAGTTPTAGATSTVGLNTAVGDLDSFFLDASVVTVQSSGYYTITLACWIGPGGKSSPSNFGDVTVDLERDDGGGYDAILTLDTSGSVGTTEWYLHSTPSKTIVQRLEAGDKLRVVCTGSTGGAGLVQLPVQETHLTIEH